MAFGDDFASGVSVLTLRSEHGTEYEEYRSSQMSEGIPPKDIMQWYTDIKAVAEDDQAARDLSKDEEDIQDEIDEYENKRDRRNRHNRNRSLMQ